MLEGFTADARAAWMAAPSGTPCANARADGAGRAMV
ncbi:MAG: hypothetical protein QOH46_399 [Solirubrobacteraceae bacterium]|jgi:hypothetical protein|nr:hypothetical protein [Solirubrobacteraceae bacterium]